MCVRKRGGRETGRWRIPLYEQDCSEAEGKTEAAYSEVKTLSLFTEYSLLDLVGSYVFCNLDSFLYFFSIE